MTNKLKGGAGNVLEFYKSYRGIPSLFFEICIGIIAAIGSLYIFLKLTHKIIDKEIIYFDGLLMDFIYHLHSPFLTNIMKQITFFGGEIFIGSAIIITIILLVIKRYRKDALIFSFVLFFGIVLNLILKGAFQRERPDFFALVTENTFSFPSGHSMNSFIFFMSLSYFIFHNTRNKNLGILLSILSGAVVLLIGISRIYLGVHYPSDVLGGYAAGLLWFVLVLLFEKIIIFLRLLREYELKKKY